MKKQSNILKYIFVAVLLLPLILAWLPESVYQSIYPMVEDQYGSRSPLFQDGYIPALFVSFRELGITLLSTMVFAMAISILLGYLSVLSMRAGRAFSNILSVIESIPSILIALFCYAPVSGALASSSNTKSTMLSLVVFVLAATATTLPEAVRSISIPLSDLYNRKYSVSFRSY